MTQVSDLLRVSPTWLDTAKTELGSFASCSKSSSVASLAEVLSCLVCASLALHDSLHNDK